MLKFLSFNKEILKLKVENTNRLFKICNNNPIEKKVKK